VRFAECAAILASHGRVARRAWPEPRRWLSGTPGALEGPDDAGHVGPRPEPHGDDAAADDWFELI
jgi:hypothetical protein